MPSRGVQMFYKHNTVLLYYYPLGSKEKESDLMLCDSTLELNSLITAGEYGKTIAEVEGFTFK